jgi:plasmid stability protein
MNLTLGWRCNMVRFIDLELEEDLYLRLRARSEENGDSMREEARHTLKKALENDPVPSPAERPENLAKAIRELFEPLGGVELEIPPREPMPDPPRFD